MERRLATVLFVDLVDSTAFVSTADPEVVRRRVTRFFEEVTRCVTTFGGIVEKFAGDAVLAAFGVAQAHEDDAERAIRAGLGILESVKPLELEVRVGIESGEVVVDSTDSTFATGEAVNLAARLQQAAGAGEILIGPVARTLALDAVELEEIDAVQVSGRPDPLPAWRVGCAVDLPRIARSAPIAPLVGRKAELELLSNTFDRVGRDRRAHFVTIYGEPGVGKSRLVREFLASLAGATVLTGRCLPYGEGITYWPLAEMVKSSAGIADDDPVQEAVEKLRAACEDDAVADLLALASGVVDPVERERSGQEIAWAARAWADQLAEVQPLVLVFEDIHWAEEPLLDLIEHLATWVREAPLLIISLARPELVDLRPGWGGGRMRATAIELDPLRADESEELLRALLPQNGLPEDARRDLLAKTEGNPLFVEETIRMLLESGGGFLAERIPDSLQALIAARIDHLRPDEKALLHRGAVIGRVFWRGALEHLAPDLDVPRLLDDLLLRDFVLPEQRSTIVGEQAYRFKHVLIREVAYAGLTKAERGRLHERFAEWLRERTGEELLEIRAHHLDHAAQLQAELDGSPNQELAHTAADALEKAGRRALAREANHSARKLLLRSVELDPTLERRYLAARAAWRLSDFPVVSREMERVASAAAEAGDREIEGLSLSALAEVKLFRDSDIPRAKELAERALAILLEQHRFRPLMVLARIVHWQGDMAAEEGYAQEARELAQSLGRVDLEAQATLELAEAYSSQLRYEEASEMIDRALELARDGGTILARAQALLAAGNLYQQQGNLDDANVAINDARRLFADVGASMSLGRAMLRSGEIALAREDAVGAEKIARESIRVLQPLEDRGTLCEVQRLLADALVAQGRLDEAEIAALEAIETTGPHDISSQASTRLSLAFVRVAQGRDEEAEALMRDAWDRVVGTGYRSLEAWVVQRLVEFLRERGRDEDGARFAERLDALSPAAAGDSSASKTERIA